MTTLAFPCLNRAHSPRLVAGVGWSCPDCVAANETAREVEEVNLPPSDAEWSTFTAALRLARRADGTVHQCDVRPHIRGRIEPKRIGQLWRRARSERLVVEVGHERSNDIEGRNAGRMEPYYELRSAA
ncbi:hypothetical protein [Nocardioides sp. BYT-33-1]|uniref:hypothetical protein n=1 Tax=Nocardioides sp. BYT-33-1 TaxID=3416952 RepID=UPI003F533B3B